MIAGQVQRFRPLDDGSRAVGFWPLGSSGDGGREVVSGFEMMGQDWGIIHDGRD